MFPPSLRVLFFEPGSQLRRLDRQLFDPSASFHVLLPASLEDFDGNAFFARLRGDEVYTVDPGNRHFVIAQSALMNVSRTSMIRYFGFPSGIIRLDPMVEEVGPDCFACLAIRGFVFSEPSRLRFIRRSAFESCHHLASITIPPSVEVIETKAFRSGLRLQEVRIGTGSRLRLIEKKAFDQCTWLQPIDVPSSAKIRGTFSVLATVYDEDGSRRKRVQFVTPIKKG
jgi:hypothetical protein